MIGTWIAMYDNDECIKFMPKAILAVRSIPKCTYKSDPYCNQKMDAKWHIMQMKNMGIDILSYYYTYYIILKHIWHNRHSYDALKTIHNRKQ